MARLDLKKSSGLGMSYENDELLLQDVSSSQTQVYDLERTKPQLLNSEITCPEIFCRKYLDLDDDGIYKKKNISINVYLVMQNLAGIEFVKTIANNCEYNRLIEVVHGGCVAIMQDFSRSLEGDIIVSNLKKGQKAIIPSGYDFSISNTKSSPLVVMEFVKHGVEILDNLDDTNGISYYIIRKNAKQEVVRNPLYRLAQKPRKINWERILINLNVTSKTPLIKQILRKYEKFDWLFSKDRFSI